MLYDFVTLDVFTDRMFGGNPLAVLPDARGLTTEQMQAIAREFNYSETTFVLPPEIENHTRKVRIFTRMSEIPFAGHPTIGTAFVIANSKKKGKSKKPARLVLELGVGEIPLDLEYAGRDVKRVVMHQPVRLHRGLKETGRIPTHRCPGCGESFAQRLGPECPACAGNAYYRPQK